MLYQRIWDVQLIMSKDSAEILLRVLRVTMLIAKQCKLIILRMWWTTYNFKNHSNRLYLLILSSKIIPFSFGEFWYQQTALTEFGSTLLKSAFGNNIPALCRRIYIYKKCSIILRLNLLVILYFLPWMDWNVSSPLLFEVQNVLNTNNLAGSCVSPVMQPS